LVSVAGGRYFGFVTGGSVPAALGADVLTAAWDQNAFSHVATPAAAVAEEIALEWVRDLLALPATATAAIVTGCQLAHVTCLAAARNEVLRRAGWDVASDGLFGAPRVRVVTGELCHVTVDRAVRLIGLGSASIERVAVDPHGRLDPVALAAHLSGDERPTIVVVQAGEVNTGSFDPIGPIVDAARGAGAWVHVDGAFGIWAAVAPELSHLVDGLGGADSWAFDAHKWLNVPYDAGIAVVADSAAHRGAMAGQAVYLRTDSEVRNPIDWTPDASRRALGFAVYAALRSLGRTGVADLVARCCAHARRLADGLGALDGVTVLNEVVLTQVLIRMADAETTERVLSAVQAGGVAWMGGTTWQGQPAIRLSVSSWRTTETDIDRTVAAFRDAAG
jgi:glutamate/tyrosine decarboxylase-like PLP-dependent enzyme